MRWSRTARILFASLAFHAMTVSAEPLRVRVLAEHPEQRARFLVALEDATRTLPWRLVEEGADVTLALGDEPFHYALRQGDPVLGVGVSRALSRVWVTNPCQCTTIWRGVSLEQQLRLISMMFPGVRRVGILLGPEQTWQPVTPAPGSQLQLEWVDALDSGQIGPLLRQYLPQWDLLLLPEDETLFNAGTAKLILLSGYRQRVPVVGPGQGFVAAGSVASVYPSLDALAQQSLNGLRQWREDGVWPAPAFVEAGSVSVNEHVARAYNLPLSESRALREKWKEKP